MPQHYQQFDQGLFVLTLLLPFSWSNCSSSDSTCSCAGPSTLSSSSSASSLLGFVGWDMDKTFDTFASLGTLQEHVSSINVWVGEGKGISKRVIDMCLCSKMKDGINFLFSQDVGDQIFGGNVSFNKLVVRQRIEFRQVLQARTIIQAIVDNHIVLRILFTEQNGDMRSNKPWKSQTMIMRENLGSQCHFYASDKMHLTCPASQQDILGLVIFSHFLLCFWFRHGGDIGWTGGEGGGNRRPIWP